MPGEGGVIGWSSSLSIVIFATAPGENIFVNKQRGDQGVTDEQAQKVKNGQKWPKNEFSGPGRENGVVIAWSSFFSIDIIATAPCDNSFVNKSEVGIKRLAMNRHKWPKMIKNPIFN